jgi:hypothetical protein
VLWIQIHSGQSYPQKRKKEEKNVMQVKEEDALSVPKSQALLLLGHTRKGLKVKSKIPSKHI